MVQPAVLGLKFDVASQAVTNGRDRYDDYQTAWSIVENVDRHHHRRAMKGWPVSDWLAEIDVVDLASPDQASASQSWRSARYCSHSSGLLRRRW